VTELSKGIKGLQFPPLKVRFLEWIREQHTGWCSPTDLRSASEFEIPDVLFFVPTHAVGFQFKCSAIEGVQCPADAQEQACKVGCHTAADARDRLLF
jgi:hypothetical protein